ncbi:dihydroneopterin aldolase [Candidatus Nomurabacteria bacterium]|nr:dihydroneopterin aldolase [Candidatus Nomurabacteria bacterium]
MDKLILKDCAFKAYIGVPDHERAKKQTILISFIGYCDTKKSAQTDSISDTVDYFAIHQEMSTVIKSGPVRLAEKLAQNIIDVLFEKFPLMKITITIKKTEPMKKLKVGWCGVEISRKRVK